jgi:hypothetical protein
MAVDAQAIYLFKMVSASYNTEQYSLHQKLLRFEITHVIAQEEMSQILNDLKCIEYIFMQN